MNDQMEIATIDGRVLFCVRDRAEYGFMSNFHAAAVEIDGLVWPTTEHFYQAQKSRDAEYQAKVRAAVSPGQAKRLGTAPGGGRKATNQSWFKQTGRSPRADWEEIKVDVMRVAVCAKFTQHADLAARLLATGDAELIEDSTRDGFWGAGPDGQGTNWLGRVLMEVRAELRAG